MFLYIHLTHWLWFNMHIYLLTFWFGSKIIYLPSNLISKIFSKCLRIVCELCSLLPPPPTQRVCACTFLCACLIFFVYLCRDREQRGPVQIATWVFVQYDEINLYEMSICIFFLPCYFFCKCCMIFLLWTIFLTYFDPLRIWRTGTIPNQGTYQMHKICFVL